MTDGRAPQGRIREPADAAAGRRRRAAVRDSIVEGCRRLPQDQDDLPWPDERTVAMIAEEPW